MRHYEPAGGVVTLPWQSGAPSSVYGTFLVEVWTMEWSIYSPITMRIKASLIPARCPNHDGNWMSAIDNTPVVNGAHQRIRRHAFLGTVDTNFTLTLGDW